MQRDTLTPCQCSQLDAACSGGVDTDDRVIRALRRGWPAGLRGGGGERLREGRGFEGGDVQGESSGTGGAAAER